MAGKTGSRGVYVWVLAVLCLVVMGVASVGGYSYYRYTQRECCLDPASLEYSSVAKAIGPLKKGQSFSTEVVTFERVPVRFLPPNPIKASDAKQYEGVTLAVDVPAGAMVLTSDLESKRIIE